MHKAGDRLPCAVPTKHATWKPTQARTTLGKTQQLVAAAPLGEAMVRKAFDCDALGSPISRTSTGTGPRAMTFLVSAVRHTRLWVATGPRLPGLIVSFAAESKRAAVGQCIGARQTSNCRTASCPRFGQRTNGCLADLAGSRPVMHDPIEHSPCRSPTVRLAALLARPVFA